MKALINGFFDNVVSPRLLERWLMANGEDEPGKIVPSHKQQVKNIRLYCLRETEQAFLEILTGVFLPAFLGTSLVAGVSVPGTFRIAATTLAVFFGIGTFTIFMLVVFRGSPSHIADQTKQFLADCTKLQSEWGNLASISIRIGLTDSPILREKANVHLTQLAAEIVETERSTEGSEEDRDKTVRNLRKTFKERHGLLLRFLLAYEKWDWYFTTARIQLSEKDTGEEKAPTDAIAPSETQD